MSGASNLYERMYFLPFFKLAGMLIIFVSLIMVIVGCVFICAVADGSRVKKSDIFVFLLFFKFDADSLLSFLTYLLGLYKLPFQYLYFLLDG